MKINIFLIADANNKRDFFGHVFAGMSVFFEYLMVQFFKQWSISRIWMYELDQFIWIESISLAFINWIDGKIVFPRNNTEDKIYWRLANVTSSNCPVIGLHMWYRGSTDLRNLFRQSFNKMS